MVIGLTGGVGAGKSTIIRWLADKGAKLLILDDIAKEMMVPGTPLMERLLRILPPNVLREDGSIDREAMAAVFFRDSGLRDAVNAEVKSSVYSYVKDRIEEDPDALYVIESAILRSSGFDDLCNEVWFVDCPEALRRERLKRSRGYSDERIDNVFAAQRADTDMKNMADFIIHNENAFSDTEKQLSARIGR